MTCAQLRTKTRTSISRKICCVRLGFQILYVVEQFSSLFSKGKYTKPMIRLPRACRGRTAVRFPANSSPTCVVWSWRFIDCFALTSAIGCFWDAGFPHSLIQRLRHAGGPQQGRNSCPRLPPPAWYGCAHAWGTGPAWCMCPPLLRLHYFQCNRIKFNELLYFMTFLNKFNSARV